MQSQEEEKGNEKKSPEKNEGKKDDITPLDLGEATLGALSRMFNLKGLVGEGEGGKRKKPKKGLLDRVRYIHMIYIIVMAIHIMIK